MAIYKRGNTWWMDVYAGNPRRRVRKSTGCTEESQARIVEQAAIGVNRGITPRERAMTIIGAVVPDKERGLKIEDMLAYYLKRISEDGSTVSKHEKALKSSSLSALAEWLRTSTSVKTVDQITPSVAWEFSCHIAKRGVSVKTRNNRIGFLSAIWKTFLRAGKAQENPWRTARAERNRDEEKHGRALTGEEIERIMKTCREVGPEKEWLGVATVGLYTGLRLRDIETLKWSEVDFKAGIIRKTPSKTKRHGTRVEIPMHPKVREILCRIPGSPEGAPCSGQGGIGQAQPGHRDRAIRIGQSKAIEAAPGSRDAATEDWVFPWRQRHGGQ
ncbi:MAG: tyrosine-type recombinase/integrase, partial [Kiritimatiellae bacterium]|nr:tyrosine-type recombinase/integrase [Kiritimatiellia bacterium]